MKTEITKREKTMNSKRHTWKVQFGIFAFLLFFSSPDVLAQAAEWKTETANDGKVIVKSFVTTRTDENGEERQLIEYIATTTDSGGIEKYISLLKDVPRHSEFLNETETRIVRANSDDEWVLYYYTDVTWPFSDTDIVSVMKYSEDIPQKTATFVVTAAPSMFEKKEGVKRYNYYNMMYTFRDLGDGNVELTISAKCSPIDPVPAWMIKAAFPGVVNDIFQKMIKLTKNG